MAQPPEFVRFVLELLAPLGEVRARAMFGGFGLYQRETIFAIIVDDRLYFKTDDATSRKYSKLGLGPFTYAARGRTTTLKYYEAPPDVFDSSEVMQSHALEAIEAALRAKQRKKG